MSRTKTLLAACALLVATILSTVFSPVIEASDAASDGMSPELAQALLAINLDKEQRAPFGAELRKYSTDLHAAINRITRRRNPDQPRTIKRKTRSLTKAMDKAMRKILRDDQWPAYEAFKVEFAQPPKIQTNSAEANAGIDAPVNTN